MKRCTLRLIGAYVGSFDLLVVVLQILQVTRNGASPWTVAASRPQVPYMMEFFGIVVSPGLVSIL